MPELHSFVRLSGLFAQSSARCWCISRETRSETFVWQQLPQHARLPDHTFGHVGQRTQIINAIRAHMGEFGIVVAKGIQNIERLIAAARNVPEAARAAVDMLADQLQGTQDRIDAVTVRIAESQADDPLARRLATAPGVGAISSSAFAATTPDVSAFRSGRDYAAWLGLTPCAHSSGGKERLGRTPRLVRTPAARKFPDPSCDTPAAVRPSIPERRPQHAHRNLHIPASPDRRASASPFGDPCVICADQKQAMLSAAWHMDPACSDDPASETQVQQSPPADTS
jgi:transposase